MEIKERQGKWIHYLRVRSRFFLKNDSFIYQKLFIEHLVEFYTLIWTSHGIRRITKTLTSCYWVEFDFDSCGIKLFWFLGSGWNVGWMRRPPFPSTNWWCPHIMDNWLIHIHGGFSSMRRNVCVIIKYRFSSRIRRFTGPTTIDGNKRRSPKAPICLTFSSNG